MVFNPKDVFSIEEYIREVELRNIENTRQQMKDMEQEMIKEIYIVFFLGSRGETVLMKEIEKDAEIEFSNREIELIKNYATQYLISDGNDLVEEQIEKKFNIKKR